MWNKDSALRGVPTLVKDFPKLSLTNYSPNVKFSDFYQIRIYTTFLIFYILQIQSNGVSLINSLI